MSMDLHLNEDGECLFEANFTYNYSGMWALAVGKPSHDPPRTFIEDAPIGATKMIEIEGMTGRESLEILHPAVEAMVSDMPAFERLNPANGWGTAELLLQRLQECIKAADTCPDAIWSAYR
jgi:hypothetical protein